MCVYTGVIYIFDCIVCLCSQPPCMDKKRAQAVRNIIYPTETTQEIHKPRRCKHFAGTRPERHFGLKIEVNTHSMSSAVQRSGRTTLRLMVNISAMHAAAAQPGGTHRKAHGVQAHPRKFPHARPVCPIVPACEEGWSLLAMYACTLRVRQKSIDQLGAKQHMHWLVRIDTSKPSDGGRRRA